ncbi:MAG: hypothetical protein ABEJ07_04700 [Candidatus Nanohaloarchaea archaeon]
MKAIYDTLVGKDEVNVRGHWQEEGERLLESSPLKPEYGMGSVQLVLQQLAEAGYAEEESRSVFREYSLEDIEEAEPAELI